MRLLISSALCSGLLLFSAAASAQVGATTGFPIGEKSRIHTSLDVGAMYDTNSRRLDNDNDADGKKGAWRLLARPRVTVDVPGHSVKFNLGAGLTASRFLAGAGTSLSGTTFGADFVAGLQLGSDDSLVSVGLKNQTVRTPVILDEPGTVGSDERRFKGWHNRGELRLTLRPGGRALEFDVGYGLNLSVYDELPNSQHHRGLLEARWKFFPKTAFVFRGEVGRFIPFGGSSNSADDPFGSAADSTVGSTPIEVVVGALGQITRRLSGELTVGYANTLSDDSALTTQGPVGTAVLRYTLTPSTNFAIGYRRQIQPVVILNSFSSDAPFASINAGLFGRLIFSAYGEYAFRRFESDRSNAGAAKTSAQVLTGDAKVEYWFFEWLNSSVNYRVQLQNPDAPSSTAGTAIFLQDFSRHQVGLNVGFKY